MTSTTCNDTLRTGTLFNFLTTAIQTAVDYLSRGQAAVSRVSIDAQLADIPPFSVVFQLANPKHGCGDEPIGYWAQTNDGDRFAGSRPGSLNICRHNVQELLEDTMAHLAERLGDASFAKVQVIAEPYRSLHAPGQADQQAGTGVSGNAITILEGDSDQGKLGPQVPQPATTLGC